MQDLLASLSNNKDKDRAAASFLLFGNGDGGGGPTAEMLEALRRLAGASAAAAGASCGGAFGALPPVAMQAPDEFFRELKEGSRDLLTW